MKAIGIFLVLMGVILIVIGIILISYDKIPMIGRLPGDIKITGRTSSFTFPITSCIIISVILSVLLGLVSKFLKG